MFCKDPFLKNVASQVSALCNSQSHSEDFRTEDFVYLLSREGEKGSIYIAAVMEVITGTDLFKEIKCIVLNNMKCFGVFFVVFLKGMTSCISILQVSSHWQIDDFDRRGIKYCNSIVSTVIIHFYLALHHAVSHHTVVFYSLIISESCDVSNTICKKCYHTPPAHHSL